MVGEGTKHSSRHLRKLTKIYVLKKELDLQENEKSTYSAGGIDEIRKDYILS